MSRVNGITDEELAALGAWRESDAFSEDDRLVLEVAEAMTATPANVSDELWGRLRARFTAEQLVELAALVATENFVSRFNRLFDIGSQDFCPLPERGG